METEGEREKLLRQIDEAIDRIDAHDERSSDADDDAVDLAKERAELENRNQP